MANHFEFKNALSQMNIFNMAVSIMAIRCIVPLIKNNSTRSNIINKIGNLSFGIYFIHILVLKLMMIGVKVVCKDVIVVMIISSVLTLIISYLIVLLCNKKLPRKVNNLLGF